MTAQSTRLLAYNVGRTLTNDEIAGVGGGVVPVDGGDPGNGSGTRQGPFYTDNGQQCLINDYTYDIGD